MHKQNALKSRRIALGLSQAQVAGAAGLKQQHLSQLETGARTLSPGHKGLLAPVLRCHPDDLLVVPVTAPPRDTRAEELVELYARLGDGRRHTLLSVARALAETQHPPRDDALEPQSA